MNTQRMTIRGFVGAAAAAVLAILFACSLFAPVAQAKTLESPIDVSDDITRIHVDKLQAGTHDYVEGATMQIINAKTGEVVTEWVTGKETHQYEKGLDVGVEYILREVKAPSGYTKVDDVHFVANEEEGTGLTILSPNPAQTDWLEMSGTYKVVLYDSLGVEQTQTTTTSTKGSMAKTGDNLPIAIVAGVVVVAAVVCVVALVARRRMSK